MLPVEFEISRVSFFYTDSVRLFATAVREIFESADEIEVTKINCKHPTPWEHGRQLANYMRLVSLPLYTFLHE
jgi:hypothetical protein